MSSANRYDAIVVGGGHNGLVAGFELAGAGLRTVVLERRELVGGACVTEEFAPGFRASPGAYVLSMLRPAIWRDMRLAQRGLVVDQAGPALNLFGGGEHLSLFGEGDRTAVEIARFSRRDALRFRAFEEQMDRLARAVLPTLDRTPPDPRLRRPSDLRGLLSFSRIAGRHRRLIQDAAYLFTTSTAQYLDGWFESEQLKSALGWESISNTLAGPKTPGTAYGLLHDHVSGVGTQSWGFVRGGMGVVTQLMADAAREAGAEIRTGAEVDRVLVDGDRATGVALVGGEELRAPIVASNADPKRTFLSLVDSRVLPSSFVDKVRAYRCTGASMKINLAVAELPVARSLVADGVQPYHRGLVQLTKPLGELDVDQAGAMQGRPAERPHLELCVPTVHDASLAPEGRHVVTIGVRSQPYRLEAGAGWDERKDEVADRVIAQIGEAFPNLPGSILHRQVLSPLDLERVLALTGGHHMHGDMAPDQLLFMRPVRGYGDYRTPIRGLYLCGAGTHPGGGVTGANGRNASREILRDARKRV